MNSEVKLKTHIKGSIPVFTGKCFVLSICPSVDRSENDDCRCTVANKIHVATHFSHHELRIENIAENTLLVR